MACYINQRILCVCMCIVRYTAVAYRSWPCFIWPYMFLLFAEHEGKCVRDLALRSFVTVSVHTVHTCTNTDIFGVKNVHC